MSKYILIVSQYFSDRHCLICDVSKLDDAELQKRLKRMIVELEICKRHDRSQSPYYGDIDDIYWRGFEDGRQYNVNDIGGDYYIVCSQRVWRLMDEAFHYKQKQFTEERVRRPTEQILRMQLRHSRDQIFHIVGRQFCVM